MATAIIGVGNLGSAVARHLVAGDEPVVLAATDEAHAKALADELGPNASAASVEDAIAASDVVVLAIWLDQSKELVPPNALAREQGRRRSLEPDRLRRERAVDPDAAGRTAAGLRGRRSAPRGRARRQGLRETRRGPARDRGKQQRRLVLFYATDDDAAEATAQRLIRAAGFEPLKVGGVSDAGRIEGPDGELQGRIFALDEARAIVATEGVKV